MEWAKRDIFKISYFAIIFIFRTGKLDKFFYSKKNNLFIPFQGFLGCINLVILSDHGLCLTEFPFNYFTIITFIKVLKNCERIISSQWTNSWMLETRMWAVFLVAQLAISILKRAQVRFNYVNF